jgi:hypothetical protein
MMARSESLTPFSVLTATEQAYNAIRDEFDRRTAPLPNGDG